MLGSLRSSVQSRVRASFLRSVESAHFLLRAQVAPASGPAVSALLLAAGRVSACFALLLFSLLALSRVASPCPCFCCPFPARPAGSARAAPCPARRRQLAFLLGPFGVVGAPASLSVWASLGLTRDSRLLPRGCARESLEGHTRMPRGSRRSYLHDHSRT